ncbi:MAG TPA: SPOR domain-containing protein [Sulfuricurvum sp.]|nr:SPOR domain-containing protein [Sulfuricurvum sp.]
MEEKNELNDIILNKGGNGSGSKKLLLAIATLTLILIIVLVIMNSLKQDEAQKSPQMILPPEPSAPTEIINDPLFEPVEVLQEGNESMGEQSLDQVAQKIKEESLQNIPTSEPVVQTAIPTKTTIQSAPVPAVSVPAVQKAAPVVQKTYAEPTIAKKPAPKKVQAATIKQEPKKVVQPKATAPVKTAAAPTPKAAETKVESKTAPAAAPTANTGTTYYVQVGSFSKEPNKVLIDRLNASGLKYTTQKVGETTKILVGPFQGEKAVQDAIGNIRQNIEAKAFKIKG